MAASASIRSAACSGVARLKKLVMLCCSAWPAGHFMAAPRSAQENCVNPFFNSFRSTVGPERSVTAGVTKKRVNSVVGPGFPPPAARTLGGRCIAVSPSGRGGGRGAPPARSTTPCPPTHANMHTPPVRPTAGLAGPPGPPGAACAAGVRRALGCRRPRAWPAPVGPGSRGRRCGARAARPVQARLLAAAWSLFSSSLKPPERPLFLYRKTSSH